MVKVAWAWKLMARAQLKTGAYFFCGKRLSRCIWNHLYHSVFIFQVT